MVDNIDQVSLFRIAEKFFIEIFTPVHTADRGAEISPVRNSFISVMPEDPTASRAAIIPSSAVRVRFFFPPHPTSSSNASVVIFTSDRGNLSFRLVSRRVIPAIPDSSSTSDVKAAPASFPIEEMIPIPVM